MKIKTYIFLFVALLLITGCRDKRDNISDGVARHTMIIYMAADNSLSGVDEDNLAKIRKAVENGDADRGNLVVYHAARRGKPRTLFEIRREKWGKLKSNVLKDYGDQNSASAETLSTVLSDVRRLKPAKTYSLVFWSHGTGWLPAGVRYGVPDIWWPYSADYRKLGSINIQDGSYEVPRTRALGPDGNRWMEFKDMAAAIPNNMFHHIIFDACFMGEVEVAYELRKKTKYLIASPAEILIEGMPYHLIMKDCFDLRLDKVCKSFFDFYDAKTGGFKSATIGLYDCTQMEALAAATKPLVSRFAAQLPTMSIEGIQTYDRNEYHSMFDIENLFDTLTGGPSDPMFAAFKAQLDRTVITKFSTEVILGVFRVKRFCGISTYIPLSSYTDINPIYRDTEWYKAVY